MDEGLVILDRIFVCPENCRQEIKSKLKELERMRLVQP